MKLEKHLDDISHIRSMMERSSKFLSLSGIAGIAVGVIGLIAAIFVGWFASRRGIELFRPGTALSLTDTWIIIGTGVVALVTALGVAIYFSTRFARSQAQKVWSPSARQLVTSLSIPVVAGALFSIILLYHGDHHLVASVLLIFYGLGLVNASRFTVPEIRHLGMIEITLGLFAAIWLEFGLYFWAFGFGLLHLVNGIFMYFKYEK